MNAKSQAVILAGEPTHAVATAPSFSFQDMHRMAVAIAKSNLFGVKDPDQALSLMMIAQADGIHPATVARDYSIIQGQAAKKAEAILRDYQRSGGRVEWHERTDTACSATFHHPAASPLRVDWNMERAAKAGLAGKDNWKKYPRAMLHARCVSEGCRATAPGSTGGMYTPEEVQDFDPPPADAVPINQAVAEAVAAPTPEEVEAHINSMDVATLPALKAAFENAWKSTRDVVARAKYKAAYDAMLIEIADAEAREKGEAQS